MTIAAIHSLADVVVHHREGTNSTRPQSDCLPRELALRVLAVSTEAQTSPDHGVNEGVANVDRVVGVGTQAATLGLAGLGPLFLLRCAIVFGLPLLTLYPLRLSSGLDLLVEEVGFDRADVGLVDVDERGGALGLVMVDAAHVGSTAMLGLARDTTEQFLQLPNSRLG